MVTGDHIETAKFVGVASGIITESEAKSDNVVMTGEDFMNKIGEYERIWNEQKEEYDVSFSDPDKFNEIRK